MHAHKHAPHTSTHEYTCMCTHIHMHTDEYASIHTCTHRHTHTLKHTNIHTCPCTTLTERVTHIHAHKHTTVVCCTLQASELREELPDFLFSLQIPSFLVGSPNRCALPGAVMIGAWGDAHLWSCDPSFLSFPGSVSPSTRLSPASRSIFLGSQALHSKEKRT